MYDKNSKNFVDKLPILLYTYVVFISISVFGDVA